MRWDDTGLPVTEGRKSWGSVYRIPPAFPSPWRFVLRVSSLESTLLKSLDLAASGFGGGGDSGHASLGSSVVQWA